MDVFKIPSMKAVVLFDLNGLAEKRADEGLQDITRYLQAFDNFMQVGKIVDSYILVPGTTEFKSPTKFTSTNESLSELLPKIVKNSKFELLIVFAHFDQIYPLVVDLKIKNVLIITNDDLNQIKTVELPKNIRVLPGRDLYYLPTLFWEQTPFEFIAEVDQQARGLPDKTKHELASLCAIASVSCDTPQGFDVAVNILNLNLRLFPQHIMTKNLWVVESLTRFKKDPLPQDQVAPFFDNTLGMLEEVKQTLLAWLSPKTTIWKNDKDLPSYLSEVVTTLNIIHREFSQFLSPQQKERLMKILVTPANDNPNYVRSVALSWALLG